MWIIKDGDFKYIREEDIDRYKKYVKKSAVDENRIEAEVVAETVVVPVAKAEKKQKKKNKKLPA